MTQIADHHRISKSLIDPSCMVLMVHSVAVTATIGELSTLKCQSCKLQYPYGAQNVTKVCITTILVLYHESLSSES